MTSKPLGKLKTIVEAAGTDISYAYEDLVFLAHNSFLLQFTESDKEILIHVNSEADRAMVSRDTETLKEIGLSHEVRFADGSLYTLTQDDDESIRIEFGECA
ncbi:MAG: hypothetical protein ABFS09_11390 [Thermodesulfobacteriota bacterium]